MEALRLQATRKQCFASARYLAERVGAEKKTWDRTLSQLRSAGLVEVERLVRDDESLSTNLLDFSALWEVLLKLLAHRSTILEWVAGTLWVKLYGSLWLTLEEVTTRSLSWSYSYEQETTPLKSKGYY